MYKRLEIWKDSVAINIAEGKGRKTKKDFAHFLNLSSASLDEADAILTICEELGFLHDIFEIHDANRKLCYRINALRNKLLAEDKRDVS